MKYLPCGNLNEFIYESNVFYKVPIDDDFEVGETVTLYENGHNHEFKVIYINYFKEDKALALINIDNISGYEEYIENQRLKHNM